MSEFKVILKFYNVDSFYETFLVKCNWPSISLYINKHLNSAQMIATFL
jgi:hypothetical protein